MPRDAVTVTSSDRLRCGDFRGAHASRVQVTATRRHELFRQLSDNTVLCYKNGMEIRLTAVYRKFPEGYAAFVEELPGANTQGATLEEARENLKEAVAMVLQANRDLAEESLGGAEVVREALVATA